MVSFTFGHRVLLLTNRYSAPGSGNDASVGGLIESQVCMCCAMEGNAH